MFRSRLPQVEIKVHTECNLGCVYCFIRKDPSDSLETDRAKAEIKRLRGGGADRLILTGGEPTIRKDLPRLIRHARSVGFADIQLFTNGLMFAYQDLLSACVDAGLSSLCLHVSSVDASIYQRLTGRNRLDALRAALKNLSGHPQLEITLLSVVNRLNIHSLPETVAYFRSWQERTKFSLFISQVIFCCVYSSSWDHRNEVLLPMEEALPVVSEILQRHREEPWPIVHQGFPYCLLPGLESHSYDLYLTLARQLLSDGSFDFTFLDTMFKKPVQCTDCIHSPYCLGLSRGYARLYGTALLQPCKEAGR
jgi:pyruvate-formate lyase-activating enzyme